MREQDPPFCCPGVNKWTLLLALALVLVVSMAWIPQVDYEWTLWLHEHEWERLTELMGRTLFEGDLPGIGDLVVFILAGIVLAYISSNLTSKNGLAASWRPQLGFIITSALVTGVGLVHSLKWIMGRARPEGLFDSNLAYTEWFQFGPHFITEGIYRGSFPSGHSAEIFILMSLAYVLAGDPRHSRRLQVTGWVWGLLVLSAALTMGLARAMSMRHWLSDSLWIILMAWITMHILYYFVLRVPNQARILERGLEPGPDRFWELGLCLYLFLFILGLMGLALGYRALLIQDPPWLGLLILPGLALGLLAWRRLKAYYQKNIRRALNEDQIWT